MIDNQDHPRPVFVLRQVQIPWSELKKDDVFRTGKGSPTDIYAQDYEWHRAMTDAVPEAAPMLWCVKQEKDQMFKGFMPPVHACSP